MQRVMEIIDKQSSFIETDDLSGGGDEKTVSFAKFNHIYSAISKMESYRKCYYNLEVSTAESSDSNSYYSPAVNTNSQEACSPLFNHMRDWVRLNNVDDRDLDAQIVTKVLKTFLQKRMPKLNW